MFNLFPSLSISGSITDSSSSLSSPNIKSKTSSSSSSRLNSVKAATSGYGCSITETLSSTTPSMLSIFNLQILLISSIDMLVDLILSFNRIKVSM